MSDSATPTSDPTLRFVDLVQIGAGRYKAINRRGGVLPIGSGDDPDFSPVELLLAAIAGCSVLDVAHVTDKRAPATVHRRSRTWARVRGSTARVRDRLCTVARTVKVGADIAYDSAED